jgi:hypothetical protein
MKKTAIVCSLLIFFILVFPFPVFAAPSNSCIVCHTNESLMKSMHKPPPLPASAGEG